MNYFRARRFRRLTITALVAVLVGLLVAAQYRSLGRPEFTTGYLLLAGVLLLACYNLRKKLPQLPLGSSTTWMQVHIYVGLGSLPVFLLHTGLRWPDGLLEGTLAAAYLLTFASGLWGLYLTRTIPAELARVGEEVIYERIPSFRRQLREQARGVVLEATATAGTSTMAEFYSTRLYDFFERPRSWVYVLRPTTRLRRALMSEMQDLRRYLSAAEASLLERLFALVRRKDDLDFHSARQGLLKGWLFAHIALTYTLVTLAVVHGLVVHVYWGGAL